MDVNKIKPNVGYGGFEVQGEARANPKRPSNFSDATAKGENSPATKSLQAVAQFSKSDLSDPQKLDSMVEACASELVDSGQSLTGKLSANDKQAVESFLSADPCFRRRIESYLQKTLT